jgi:hypothetical protein
LQEEKGVSKDLRHRAEGLLEIEDGVPPEVLQTLQVERQIPGKFRTIFRAQDFPTNSVY